MIVLPMKLHDGELNFTFFGEGENNALGGVACRVVDVSAICCCRLTGVCTSWRGIFDVSATCCFDVSATCCFDVSATCCWCCLTVDDSCWGGVALVDVSATCWCWVGVAVNVISG